MQETYWYNISMPMWLKKSPTEWVSATKIWVKKSPTEWVPVTKAWIKKNATTWVHFWPSAGPQIDSPLEISSNVSSYPATLTGRNYHWDSGDTFNSKFQKGTTATGPWSDITSFEFIANPNEGLSNTKTKILLESDFVLNQSSTWFRFVVRAQDSIEQQETIEFSDPIEITVPDPIMTELEPTTVTATTISIPFTYDFALKYYIVEAYGPAGLVSSTRIDTPSSPIVVQNLSPNTTYDIVVFPYNFVNMVGIALLGIGITTLAAKPVNTTIPNVTPATGVQGSTTYSSTTGSWTNSPTSYSYQWQYRDQGALWLPAPGTSTNSTYLPPSNYVSIYGSDLRCRVIANNGSVASDPAFSNTVQVTAGTRTVYWNANGGTVSPTSNTGFSPFVVVAPTPTRSGFTMNGWYDTPSLDFTYSVAAGNTFTIPYDGITMYARWTQIIAPVNTVAPSVTPASGTAGSTTFSSTTGSWNNSPTSYSYQWQYNDQGSTWLSISNATNPTYLPPSNYNALYGSSLRCAVTASNSAGSNVAFSNTVSVVLNRTINWNANGGVVSPTSNTIPYPWIVTTPTPTRSGFLFSNWRNPVSGDLLYTVGAGVPFTIPFDGITMYAIWTTALPGTPTSLTASTDRADGVNLTFSGSANATSYDIYWNILSANRPASTVTPDFSSVSSPYLDTTITVGASRQYWVRGKNAQGTSEWFPLGSGASGVVGTRISAPPFFPPFFPFFPPFFPFFPPFFPFFPPTFTGVITPTISNLAVSGTGRLSRVLSWTSTNQASYSIATSPTTNLDGATGFTATSRTFSGLAAATTYNVTVTVTASSGATASASTSFST